MNSPINNALSSAQRTCDFNQASAFCLALSHNNPEEIFDFRCIHDQDKGVPAIPRRGTLAECWQELCQWNAAGYGIFCTINRLDGLPGHHLTNVQEIRAHFVDLDNLNAAENLNRANSWQPAPAFAVQSSPNKFHIYWPVVQYLGNERFTTVQRKLLQTFEGDKTVIDASRVMRLPGTYHLKGEPQLVTCFFLSGWGYVTPVEAFEHALQHVNVMDFTGTRKELGDVELTAPSLPWLQTALRFLDPNTLTREEWISFSAAFKQAGWNHVPDEQTLFSIWSDWCGQYKENDPAENLKQWNSIRDTQLGWKSITRRLPELQAHYLHAMRLNRIEQDKVIGDDLQFRCAPEIKTLEQMEQDFVFVGNGSSVVNRTNKTVRTFNDAANDYAASTYSFDTRKIDKDGNSIIKTVPAIGQWKASENRITVDTLTWNPQDGEICRSPERGQGGDRAYNLWSGVRLMTPPDDWQEWAKPFTDHVAYLVPDLGERERFLKWCAHIIQHPGVLPHTCYLMVTQTTGTGRGTLGSMLTRALRGYVAVNMNVDALFGGFNGRISQKLLATVDEIHEGNSNTRYEKQEAFKSKLTEETRAINPKYGLQSVEKNCCRWLMFSNHHDALPFDNSDRRVIVIDNPANRQSQEYYSRLNNLLNDQRFIASIQQYLVTLALNDFNPHEPAPMNAAKIKSLQSMESQADSDAKQFAAQWPGELATIADLREFMGENVPSSRAMNRVIDRAGMKSAHKQKVHGTTQTVLIVRGNLTPDDIKSADKQILTSQIFDSQAKFRNMS